MGVLIFLFALIPVSIILHKSIDSLKNETTSEISVPATLVDKSLRTSNDFDSDGISRQLVTYYLLFEIENGERLEFVVGHRNYKLYAIGDKGILRYQRKRFNSFDR